MGARLDATWSKRFFYLVVYSTSTCESNLLVHRMADIEEQTATLNETFKSVFPQWRGYVSKVQAIAADLQNAKKENASLREQLRKLESKASDLDRLTLENQSLREQIIQASASKIQQCSDDEHFSVPATQVLANTPPASDEIDPHFARLLREHHEQAVKIETLTSLLRAEKEKSKKWRLKYNISSSPAPTPPQRAPATKETRASSPLPSGLPYPSTAFDPRPLDGDCTRVSVSPEQHEKAKPVHIKVEALQEGNGNARKKRRVSTNRGVEAISSIAEDGDNHNPKLNATTSTIKKKISSPTSTTAHGRLGQLLSDSNPPRPRLSGADAYLPPRRPAVVHGSPPRRPRFMKPKARKTTVDAEDEEPFRARPLHRLSLNHFKINPETNEGLDFAYQEVVRNHHARKCLSGCTDKCCVDKWRALAHTLYNTDNRGDETLDQQISNNSLLLDMLGPNSEEKIRTLTPAARANLIEEARVRQVSAQYSKHRAAHPRAASPPGFWDTDMASSQENAENRAKADKLEREEVERRYQDAMRGNGRWVFADE